MPDFDAVFDTLGQLDEKARQAVELSGAMYEELYLEVDARARKAEWLLDQFCTLASERGLVFDLAAASERWDAHHPRPETPLTSRYHTLLLETDNEARNLQRLLDDALDGRERAEIRAETAERERDALAHALERHIALLREALILMQRPTGERTDGRPV